MANAKRPTEGGSGGKRGHSGMEHWEYTAEIKDAARTHRRIVDKAVVDEALGDLHAPAESAPPDEPGADAS